MKIKVTTLIDVLMVVLVITIYCFDGIADMLRYETISIILFCGVYILYLIQNRYIKSTFFSITLPFLALCFLSFIWSTHRSTTISRSITVLQVVIVCGLLFDYVFKEDKVDLLIKALTAGGTLFGLYIINYYGGVSSFIRMMNQVNRIGADVTHLSRIGQSMALSAILCMYMTFQNRKKPLYYIANIIDFLVILACQSRTALIVTIIGYFCVVVANVDREHRKSLIYVLGVFIIIFVLFLNFYDFSNLTGGISNLISAISGSGGDLSSRRRIAMITEGLKSFVEHPILGTGLATSGDITLSITGESKYLHNNYVEMLATLGITGFLAFFSMYFIPFIRLRKMEKNVYTRLANILLISEAVMFMGTVSYYVKFHYLFLVLILAISELESEKSSSAQEADRVKTDWESNGGNNVVY